jgi:hypothetical protein
VRALPFEDGAPDLPVERHQLGVDGERGTHLRAPDALPEVAHEGLIVFRHL